MNAIFYGIAFKAPQGSSWHDFGYRTAIKAEVDEKLRELRGDAKGYKFRLVTE